jgi:hypothetical protein
LIASNRLRARHAPLATSVPPWRRASRGNP